MSAVLLIAQATAQQGDNVVVLLAQHPARHPNQRAELREVAKTPGNAAWQLDLDAAFAQCDARKSGSNAPTDSAFAPAAKLLLPATWLQSKLNSF